MTLPDYQSIMLPLLELIKDGREYSLRDAVEALAGRFGLTEQDRRQPLPSGRQTLFYDRTTWARTYLKQAGMLEPTKRGHFRITDRGLTALKDPPSKFDARYLEKFPEFKEFRSRNRDGGERARPATIQEKTPVETLETAYQQLQQELAAEVQQQLKASSPGLFENVVVDLLVKMGYGGNRSDAVEAIGKPGDEGIDGVIKEDRLGLDAIYIQAKKWDHTVGRPEVQKFAGALAGKHAKKGIFITTSDFSDEAKNYASSIETKIILIDGQSLAKLMVEFNVGVAVDNTYELKKLDSDYFI